MTIISLTLSMYEDMTIERQHERIESKQKPFYINQKHIILQDETIERTYET